MIYERISLGDETLFSSHAEYIQQYQFAAELCRGKRVMDAGCGSGFGSRCLAKYGATSVLGLDYSDDAIGEATKHYRADGITYRKMDIETIGTMNDQFDVVVNLAVLPHLPNPDKFLSGTKKVLSDAGIFVTSTPNWDRSGQPHQMHFHTFSQKSFMTLLSAHFPIDVSFYGQWLTHDGMLRKIRAREHFEQVCDSYYNPMSRAGRMLKRLFGRKTASAPDFKGQRDSFTGDFVILPLDATDFQWEPTTLLAIAKK